MSIRLLLGSLVLYLFMSGPAFAFISDSTTKTDTQTLHIFQSNDLPYMLVEADDPRKDDRNHNSGSLIIPIDSSNKKEKDTKKCMTVCLRWGEDCIIDPARGRKCRRTCKEFGEECF